MKTGIKELDEAVAKLTEENIEGEIIKLESALTMFSKRGDALETISTAIVLAAFKQRKGQFGN